ncbi:MAG: amylo-alpha-1,6-glucosidase [Planctomycetaceae bacterium]
MQQPVLPSAEWLETDGLGGFASGTVSTRRTRRYHAWLLSAKTPPTARYVLVNGGDVWIETDHATTFLSSQHYAPNVIVPECIPTRESFETEPWPTWVFQLPDGLRVRQELLVVHGVSQTLLRWTLLTEGSATSSLRLGVRPFFSGRDYHALHHENPNFQFAPEVEGRVLRWRPYPGVPSVEACSNGRYLHEPMWYRQFLYPAERDRGLDFLEDLAAPGAFVWDLRAGPAVLIWTAQAARPSPRSAADPLTVSAELVELEQQRRAQFASPLERAADAYAVRRGRDRTLIAGYPWFTDWGRDTFIALRGLCLTTGRFELAEQILLAWSNHVSEGMVPNRFPDSGELPEYNSVDASLWYAIAVADFLRRAPSEPYAVADSTRQRLESAVGRILSGYASGTRFKICMDFDNLIAAGEPGMQLTWMDAKVGDWVMTPRIGKPVEVQALWLNALHAFQHLSPNYESWFRTGVANFRRRFWNPDRQCLFDVVDCDHVPDRRDNSIRPNQILAVGGLPLVLLSAVESRAVVDRVQTELWTPCGLRTLSPSDPAYHGRYQGGVVQRDAAYHQGTVWPWLAGPFTEAWLRTYGNSPDQRQFANDNFLKPLASQLESSGLGHLPEVADGDPPHAAGGCPFQAWSLGEYLRIKRELQADPPRNRE